MKRGKRLLYKSRRWRKTFIFKNKRYFLLAVYKKSDLKLIFRWWSSSKKNEQSNKNETLKILDIFLKTYSNKKIT